MKKRVVEIEQEFQKLGDLLKQQPIPEIAQKVAEGQKHLATITAIVAKNQKPQTAEQKKETAKQTVAVEKALSMEFKLSPDVMTKILVPKSLGTAQTLQDQIYKSAAHDRVNSQIKARDK